MMAVYRIYVEKKPEFAVEAKGVLADLRTSLRVRACSSHTRLTGQSEPFGRPASQKGRRVFPDALARISLSC